MQRTFAPVISATFGALLALSGPVLAAPPPGVGGGPPGGFPGGAGGGFPGRGASSMNTPWGADRSEPTLPTQQSPRGGSMAHSPSSVLQDNPRAASALGNALAKSGVGLPAGGLQAACAGFGNLGNCVAALHVAKNLALPGGFDALKHVMTTGDKLPLGRAITQLDPHADASPAEASARKQARADLRQADAASDGD
ncbi:MAG: hypothetical protein RLZZ427_436 [Pseudomonadota bacterium]